MFITLCDYHNIFKFAMKWCYILQNQIIKETFLHELCWIVQDSLNTQAQIHGAGTLRNLAAGEHIQVYRGRVQVSLGDKIFGYSPIFLAKYFLQLMKGRFIKDLPEKDILACFSTKNYNSVRF